MVDKNEQQYKRDKYVKEMFLKKIFKKEETKRKTAYNVYTVHSHL